MCSTATSNIFFSPFVLSLHRMLRKETQVVLATFSSLMAAEKEKPILHIKVWVDIRITIAVARSYYQILREDHVTSPLGTQDTDWELDWGSVLGLGLAQ